MTAYKVGNRYYRFKILDRRKWGEWTLFSAHISFPREFPLGKQRESRVQCDHWVKEKETGSFQEARSCEQIVGEEGAMQGKVPEFCSGIPESQLNTNLPCGRKLHEARERTAVRQRTIMWAKSLSGFTRGIPLHVLSSQKGQTWSLTDATRHAVETLDASHLLLGLKEPRGKGVLDLPTKPKTKPSMEDQADLQGI